MVLSPFSTEAGSRSISAVYSSPNLSFNSFKNGTAPRIPAEYPSSSGTETNRRFPVPLFHSFSVTTLPYHSKSAIPMASPPFISAQPLPNIQSPERNSSLTSSGISCKIRFTASGSLFSDMGSHLSSDIRIVCPVFTRFSHFSMS